MSQTFAFKSYTSVKRVTELVCLLISCSRLVCFAFIYDSRRSLFILRLPGIMIVLVLGLELRVFVKIPGMCIVLDVQS